MTPRNWMRIAALISAWGVTGAAIAQKTEGTTSAGDRASASASGMDTPSAGAIVTPEDMALGMGRDKEPKGDADNSPSSNDDELLVHPEPSSHDESSINPGPSNDDESSVKPGSSNGRDLIGPDVNPAAMGAGSPRGQ